MGYKTARDIPNYWKYASKFVLQDAMFSPVESWSLPEHLFMVSAWSARCTKHFDPMSCSNDPASPKWQHNGLQPPPDLRLDGPDLPAAQVRCQLALLRRQRYAARLPARERHMSPVPAQNPFTPSSGTRSRTSTPCAQTASSRTSST